MKFTLAALTAFFALAAAGTPEIKADSQIGKHLLSHARRLEQNNQQQEEDFEMQYNWVTGYSVKFQGCHHIMQWNEEADGEEDVKIQSKRLVRFRLCPSDTCSATSAGGCNSGYGDYIMDMELFMQAYIEGKQQQDEYDCQYHLLYNCDCDGENQGDDFNEEYCQYDCYNDAEMYQCIERNPYQDDQQQQEEVFQLEDYMECRQLNIQNNNGGRQLNQEVQYFVGPYCSQQGGAIKLGMFTDDECTIFADDVDFETLMGYTLPYSGEEDTLIDERCFECVEHDDPNNQNQNDQQDADDVNQMCEQIYMNAGKCEANLPEGMAYSINNNACTYMEGIRIIREDGILDLGSSRPSATATAFIVVFAMAFAAMAFYVWYLRTRLGVKKNTLL